MSARADRDRLAREPAVVHERIAQLQAAAARRGRDPCTRLISIELFHDQVTEELKRAQRHDLAVALLERDRYTGEHSKSFMRWPAPSPAVLGCRRTLNRLSGDRIAVGSRIILACDAPTTR